MEDSGAPGLSGEDRLAAFYNQRAVLHPEHPLTPQRVQQREWFIARLKAEGRHAVLEIGSGPGLDGLEFVQAGIHYTGVDISEEQVRLATSKGLEVSVASVRSLPFADRVFPALWTMSTLLHIPNQDIGDVVRELVRVAAPGALIAVGLWSGDDEEVLNPEDEIQPPRFFSRRSDAALRRIFSRHGEVEEFVTWPEGTGAESGPGAGHWTQHYQFLVLRTRPDPPN